MEAQALISAAKMQTRIGREIDVMVDAVDDEVGPTGRSKADAPEIGDEVLRRDSGHVSVGDIVRVHVEDADDTDLFGVVI